MKIQFVQTFLALTALLMAGGCSSQKKLVEVRDYLIGTHIAIRLVPVKGRDAASDGRRELASLREEGGVIDANRDDSLFAKLSQDGVYPWKDDAASNLVRLLLTSSISLAEKTGGAFDPAIGALSRLWGFSSLSPRKAPPSADEIALARSQSGWRRILSNGPDGVRVLPGTWIDLGGIAKGVFADRMAARLRGLGYRQGILDLGGNILVLGGRPGGPWRVAVRHPRAGNSWLGTIHVRDQAVVTSGEYERYFIYQNKRYHHILNPVTGLPASGTLSVRSCTASVRP